jgi:hypothetical protein
MDLSNVTSATGASSPAAQPKKTSRRGRSHSAIASTKSAPLAAENSKPELSAHRHSRSVNIHRHGHLHLRSASKHEPGLDPLAVEESMTDLSRKIKGLREHTPSLHGSGHHHHHYGHKKEVGSGTSAQPGGMEMQREESREERLRKWAEEQERETQRDECRNT